MSVNLVWFRNDLRVNDNPALFHACDDGQPVVAIYIATPEQWQRHDEAPIKRDFWRRNLVALREQLATLNIELHFFQVDFFEHVPNLLSNVCEAWSVSSLFMNNEYGVNERERDRQVSQFCYKMNVTCHGYDDQTLIKPGTIRTQTGEPYKVFTPFSKVARAKLDGGVHLLSIPSPQHHVQLNNLKQECDLESIPWPSVDSALTKYWPAGEVAASRRLSQFCQNSISDYHKLRDIPSSKGTSKLSAYLTSGVLSVRQCWSESTRYCEKHDGVLTWQNELLWRDFYKHVLIDFPHVSKHKPWRLETDALVWRIDEEQLEAWQQGRTGFPIIDAAMRQLLQTGWMHNRLRMVVAMFLSKHLLLDWRLGERWFMQHLIDGELAANNGGWQWSASTGTDAVPYFRIFNPIRQSQRFDLKGDFIRQYVPELANLSDKDIHQPKMHQRSHYYPEIVDLKVGRERAIAAFKELK
jgi:deoxyribodipyrimidine photo-lyase